jgi:hypothetical protein
MEVRVGNVEVLWRAAAIRYRREEQHHILALIGRNLEIIGRNGETKVTPSPMVVPGYAQFLTVAGVKDPPILAWYHIAMRLQHSKLSAGGLADDSPGPGSSEGLDRRAGRAASLADLERQGEERPCYHQSNSPDDVGLQKARPDAAARACVIGQAGHALHEIDEYLSGQSV